MRWAGLSRVAIDPAKNLSAIGTESDVSAPSSKVRVLTIPTNEEKLITIDTMEATKAAKDCILVEKIP